MQRVAGRMRSYWTFGMIGVIGALGLAIAIGLGERQPLGADRRIDPPSASEREAIASARDLSTAFRYAARTIGPAVVHITSETEKTITRQDLFGRRYTDNLRGSGLGSGVIVSADGHILTNAHVIEDATSVVVHLSDGREMAARVVGRDRATDLAVLKIDARGLTPAEFGDSEAMEVGDWLLAVGSPFGFNNTVTSGIVSAKGRTGLSRSDADRYEDFIQTDAAINPGNSGGPIVNLEGEVIGISTAIFSRGGGSNGIGFAIPSAIAKNVLESIIASGRVERGYLGVVMNDLRPEAIDRLGLRETGGVYLSVVEEKSPAARAGLRVGDIVTTFNGRPVHDATRMRTQIALTPPGEQVRVDVLREDSERSLTVTLASATSALAQRVGGVASAKLGLIIDTVDERVLRDLGYSTASGIEGVVVREVLPNSPAERAGLDKGDIIYSVDRLMVLSEREFLEAAERADLGGGVRVRLLRDGRRRYTDLAP